MALTRRLGSVPGVGAALFVTYLVIGTFFVIPRVTADGVAYYAETRSLIVDGDLDLSNEYAIPVDSYSPLGDAGPRAVAPREPDGSFDHHVNLGIAALFGPFLLAAQLVGAGANALAGVLGAAAPFTLSGYERIAVLGVAFGVNALVAAGLTVMGRFLEPLVGRAAAIGAAIATWLGTGLFFWSTQRPAHAHAALVVVECAFVVLFLMRGRDARQRWAWLVLGALWGLMLTVRPIAGLYAAVPLAFLVVVEGGRAFRAWSSGEGRWQVRARAALRALVPAVVAGLLFLAGSLLGRLPQLIFAADPSLIGSGYYADTSYVRGALGGDLLTGSRSLLFDANQGLAWWLPLVPVSLVGLLAIWRRDRGVAIASLTWVALIWGFAAALDAPERFGGLGIPSRHLVEATPAYVIGVAGLIAGARDVAGWVRGRGGKPWLIRAVPVTAALGVGLLATWGAIAQLAGSIVSVEGLGPIARVAAVLARPPVIGRLWYTPATETAAEGKVDLGGHLAAAILNGSPTDFGLFLSGFAWLVAIGIVVVGLAALAWPLLAGRWGRGVAPDVDADLDEAPAAAPARTVGAVARTGARTAIAWIPLVITLVLLAGLAAPAFTQPGTTRDGDELTIRTWDGRRPGRPPGVVTAVTYGRSPSGNTAVLPPVPNVPTTDSDIATMTRGTFLPIGEGRDVSFVPPPGWDVLSDILLWFGPNFDPAAAVTVSLGPDDGTSTGESVTLQAADLALGVVPVRLPVLTRGTIDEAVLLRVTPVEGRPAPLVSVHGDGSLAYRLHGLQGKRLPSIQFGRDTIVPVNPQFTLPENGSVTVDEAGARMRVGPWGPEQMLRWSSAHEGWVLKPAGLGRPSWTDAITTTAGAEPLVVEFPAPLPIEAATIHVMASAAAGATDASVELQSSTDGATWTPLAIAALPPTGRAVDVTATSTPPAGTTSIGYRVVPSGAAGAVELNAMWYDATLTPTANEIGRLRSDRLELLGEIPGSGAFAPVTVEIAGGEGRVNAGLRAVALASQQILLAPGAVASALIAALLLLGAIVAWRRRASGVLVGGLVSLGLLVGLTSALAVAGFVT